MTRPKRTVRAVRPTISSLAPAQPGRRGPSPMTPGSFEARAAGCICKGPENLWGRGQGDQNYPYFEVAPGCDLHDDTPDAPGTRRCDRCSRVIEGERTATIHAACLRPSELRERERRLERQRAERSERKQRRQSGANGASGAAEEAA